MVESVVSGQVSPAGADGPRLPGMAGEPEAHAPGDVPRWVDTHCHLQLADESPDVLLGRAGNVQWVVAPGTDLETSRASIDLAGRFPGRVLATAGLHPHDAELWPAQADAIAELVGSVAAIGETGLDYYRDLSPRRAQRDSFAAQLALAAEADLPVIVHTRDAFADVFAHVEEHPRPDRVVMHCWTGGPRWTKRFAELGVTFSFAGPVAFETGETVRFGAAEVPPERCLVETDTPYLAPPPHRGEPNEPAHVAYVGRALAEVWGMDVADVARSTSRRATEVFRD